MDELCRHLPWDSRFFGFPIATSLSSRPSGDDAVRMVSWCADHGVRCLYHEADPDFAPGLASVAKCGFELIDMRHELDVSPIVTSQEWGVDDRLRVAMSDDHDGLVDIARFSFSATRFGKDVRFPRDRVADMYAAWLLRALEGGLVIVTGPVGEPRGFIAVESDHHVARIGLMAVKNEFRGEALSKLLVEGALSLAAHHGFGAIRVVTQSRNIAALRVYEGAGFKTRRVSLWYHRWF